MGNRSFLKTAIQLAPIVLPIVRKILQQRKVTK